MEEPMDIAAISERAAIELHPQTTTPVVVVDRQYCFDSPVVLSIKQNVWTKTIKVRDSQTGKVLFRVKHEQRAVCDKFSVFDENAKQAQLLTVIRFGESGDYKVFKGEHDYMAVKEPGLFIIHVTKTESTVDFVDATSARSSHVVVEASWRDRVAVLSVAAEPNGAWQAVARINHPQNASLHREYFTLEIAAGVDALLVVLVWLGRWNEWERHDGNNTLGGAIAAGYG